MSLYKRGDVWWYDFTVNNERFRGSTQLRSKTAAKIVEDNERQRAKLGTISARPLTLKEAADRWFATRIVGRASAATTAMRLEIMLRHVDGGLLVGDVSSAVIVQAIESRRLDVVGRGRKVARAPTNSTVNRDLIDTTLRPILNHAKRVLGAKVQDIPWADIALPEPKDRDRPYTAAERTAWREGLPEWHKPVWDFMDRYGVRLGEAFFPPENYDPETGRVLLRIRKGGKPHTIRLLPEDRAEMNARYSRATEAKLRTLWFKDDGKKLTPIHRRAFQSASKASQVKAGMTDARPAHDLRHEAGTRLMRRTGNLAAVKRMLGHENIQSTMRYVHADDEDVFEALRHTYGTEAPKQAKSRVKTKRGTGT